MPPKPYRAKLIVSESKATLSPHLHRTVIQCCAEALSARDAFTVALSGGSLPSFLSTLAESFASAGVDPKFDSWHVILADERCVPHTDDDSNLKSLRENFLNGASVSILPTQVYGIDEALLPSGNPGGGSTSEIARSYETKVVRPILAKSGGLLDLAVLGFGPDGHTCSLFPGHELLTETEKLVAPIENSPKPPPRRITLTLPVLNDMTRTVVFCGAGESKGPILDAVFNGCGGSSDVGYKVGDAGGVIVGYADPPPYPCGMVRPRCPDGDGASSRVVWVVDEDAAKGLGRGGS